MFGCQRVSPLPTSGGDFFSLAGEEIKGAEYAQYSQSPNCTTHKGQSSVERSVGEDSTTISATDNSCTVTVLLTE